MGKEKILLFGAGNYARKILDKIEIEFEIVAFIDNDKNNWNKMFEEKYSIISINEYHLLYSGLRIFVAVESMKLYLEISEQLKISGVYCEHINDALCTVAIEHKKDFYIDKSTEKFIDLIKKNECAFVLTAPSHSNLGDQAQSFCISELLERTYPSYEIVILDEDAIKRNFYELLYIIKRYIKNSDLIFLHSGYRLTNLYMTSEYIVEMMARLFCDKKMLFLPQTVHYTDKAIEQRISRLITSNVSIMCRDEQSFINAEKLFPNSKVLLYPDIVTSLIGKYNFDYERNGILMVMRNVNDGESLLSDFDVRELKKRLEALDNNVEIADTTIDENWETIAKNRKFYVEKEIERYSKYKVVITNRYHGTIFSMAANTPVIILPTKDHKITSGIKWFEKARMNNYIFCKDINEVENYTRIIVREADYTKNNSFFYDNYFSRVFKNEE